MYISMDKYEILSGGLTSNGRAAAVHDDGAREGDGRGGGAGRP
jgi:hypothetical protein